MSIISPNFSKSMSLNRTRRNWNTFNGFLPKNSAYLLIAPEGIEIQIYHRSWKLLNSLNRTRRNWNISVLRTDISQMLSLNRTRRNWNTVVNVVPIIPPGPLNRTRRNWNNRCSEKIVWHQQTLNRTRRNWNIIPPGPTAPALMLLIAPEGIEIYLTRQTGMSGITS